MYACLMAGIGDDAAYWQLQAISWQTRYATARAEAFDEAAKIVARRMAGWGDDEEADPMQDVWEKLMVLRERAQGS